MLGVSVKHFKDGTENVNLKHLELQVIEDIAQMNI